MDVSDWFRVDFDQFDFEIPAVPIAYSVRLLPPLPRFWLFWHFRGGLGTAWFKAAGCFPLSQASSSLGELRIVFSISS